MAKKDLLSEPHTINNKTWWYEENKGICICVDTCSGVKQFYITWRALRHALNRKDK